jgi:hypothetical protein
MSGRIMCSRVEGKRWRLAAWCTKYELPDALLIIADA